MDERDDFYVTATSATMTNPIPFDLDQRDVWRLDPCGVALNNGSETMKASFD